MTNTRTLRDSSGKKAGVRRVVTPGSEHVDTAQGHDWYVDPRTGRYYVVPLGIAGVTVTVTRPGF